MTDKEIMKALGEELKTALIINHRFEESNDTENPDDHRFIALLSRTIDLINRQQAEIERLEKTEIEIDDFCRRLCRMRMLNGNAIASYKDLQNYIQEEKSEAVKEFAESLCKDRVSNDPVVIAVKIELKEWLGDTE